MTDGRIPGKWINEPRFVEMSVDAWCIFTKAIAWSNEAGTDGLVKRRYLGHLHPQGEMPAANQEIVALGLWHPTADGFQFIDWNKKAHHGGLGQELAAVVQGQKERSKSNQQAYRDRLKGKSDDTAPVTGDVIANVSDHVGQDRKGQASDNEVPFEESFNQETGEVFGGVSWDSAPVEQILPADGKAMAKGMANPRRNPTSPRGSDTNVQPNNLRTPLGLTDISAWTTPPPSSPAAFILTPDLEAEHAGYEDYLNSQEVAS